MSHTSANSTTPLTKEIVYDRTTRDYEMRIDGQCVGFASTYSEAERRLDELVYEMLVHGTADIERVPVAVAHDGETETTSFAISETEVCVHDNRTVSVYMDGRALEFRTPEEMFALRALIHIFDQSQVRALIRLA